MANSELLGPQVHLPSLEVTPDNSVSGLRPFENHVTGLTASEALAVGEFDEKVLTSIGLVDALKSSFPPGSLGRYETPTQETMVLPLPWAADQFFSFSTVDIRFARWLPRTKQLVLARMGVGSVNGGEEVASFFADNTYDLDDPGDKGYPGHEQVYGSMIELPSRLHIADPNNIEADQALRDTLHALASEVSMRYAMWMSTGNSSIGYFPKAA